MCDVPPSKIKGIKPLTDGENGLNRIAGREP